MITTQEERRYLGSYDDFSNDVRFKRRQCTVEKWVCVKIFGSVFATRLYSQNTESPELESKAKCEDRTQDFDADTAYLTMRRRWSTLKSAVSRNPVANSGGFDIALQAKPVRRKLTYVGGIVLYLNTCSCEDRIDKSGCWWPAFEICISPKPKASTVAFLYAVQQWSLTWLYTFRITGQGAALNAHSYEGRMRGKLA